ncbi:MAG: folate-binding protein YgfZ [Sphingomonas sp. 28-66-16]|nr:MAG: folate-binding protein YgfZ [Sphingomonas sp. 28-66-16]
MLADRSLIRLSGEDVRGFVQGLITQDVSAISAGSAVWAGLLTPQGKVLFDFLLWGADDGLLIDCARASAEALARRLTLYRLRRAITIEPVDGAVHWAPPSADGAARGVADPRLATLGTRWLGPPDMAGDASAAWRAHRLALGVTEGVDELGDGDTLWLECNARELNGVSFTKGCYVGQENTARMHHRAKVSRRLVVAPIGEAGERTRARYPELGLMIERRRIDALGDALIPAWLAAGLADASPAAGGA